MLVDVEDVAGRGVGEDRNRFVQTVLGVEDGGLHLCGSLSDHCGQSTHHRWVLHCCRPGQDDLFGGDVVDQRIAIAVEDQPTGRSHLHDTESVGVDRLGGSRRFDRGERPQPKPEQSKERDHHQGDDPKPESGT